MIKYFRFQVTSVGGFQFTIKEETAKEINKYAEENELKIVSISLCGDNGMFVVFEKIGE